MTTVVRFGRELVIRLGHIESLYVQLSKARLVLVPIRSHLSNIVFTWLILTDTVKSIPRFSDISQTSPIHGQTHLARAHATMFYGRMMTNLFSSVANHTNSVEVGNTQYTK